MDIRSTVSLVPDTGDFLATVSNPLSVVTVMKTDNIVYINPVRLTLIVSSILSDGSTITDHSEVNILPNITSVETKEITLAEGTRRGSFLTEVPGLNKYTSPSGLVYRLIGEYSDYFSVDANGDIFCTKTISFVDMGKTGVIYAFFTELDVSMTITAGDTRHVAKLLILVVRDDFSREVSEISPENTNVGNFRQDASVNPFVLELIDTSTQSDLFRYFQFDTQSGDLKRSSGILDFSNTNNREFIFEIRISWKPATTFIRIPGQITVVDANNKKPVFVDKNPVFTVISGSPSGTYIGSVEATDEDTVGTVSYHIKDAEYAKVFEISEDNGVITAIQAITTSHLGDSVTFTVDASDGVATVVCHIVVDILKLSNENANLNLIFNGTLEEELNPPNVVANVSVQNYTNFKFMTTRDNEYFRLNPTSGLVTSKQKLDRENLPSVFRDNKVTFGIQANLDDEDSCTITIMGDLTITVTDINDNPPCFDHAESCISTFKGSVMENMTVPQQVTFSDAGVIKVSDKDEIDHGHLTVTLEPRGIFNLKIVNDVVTISAEKVLDREQTNEYRISLHVRDTGDQNATATLSIIVQDTNDNPPVFTKDFYEYSIKEDTHHGTEVGKVKATDLDIGQNAEIRYSVYSSYFSIDEITGMITTRGHLDRESIASFNITLLARDNGYPRHTATATVSILILDVNDNNPVFTQNEYRFKVPENNFSNVSIGSVSASDQDTGNNSAIIFSIFPKFPAFNVNKNGEIFSNNSLDHEETPKIEFTVTATDNGNPSRSSTTHVVIEVEDVNDNPPRFKSNVTMVNVTANDFNSPKLVALLEVTDKDTGDNGQFNLFLCQEYKRYFTITDAGAVSTTQQTPEHLHDVCEVKATDKGNPPMSSHAFIQFYLDTTGGDTGVTFNSSNFILTVPEVHDDSTTIGKLWIKNNKTSNLSFTLISSVDGQIADNTLMTSNASFHLDRRSGEVMKSGILDREAKDLYTFLASVQENNDEDLTLVTIHVEDVNEPPKFVTRLKQFDVNEDVLNHMISRTGSKMAEDDDLGDNGTLVFTITNQEPKQGDELNFEVNVTNGYISVVRALDYETAKQYNITMEVRDKGRPPLRTTRTFEVLVNDVNDNPPTFVNASGGDEACLYNVDVFENVTVDSVVFDFEIEDKDGKTNFRVSRLGILNTDACPLKPASDTYGYPTMSVLSKELLDYESQQEYDCLMTVANKEPKYSSNCSVHLFVKDVNDNHPQTHGPYVVNVTNGKVGDIVLQINATDADTDENARLSYGFANKTESTTFFGIREDTGELTITKDLFQFTLAQAVLEVNVSDSGLPPLTNITSVTINIISNNTQPWFQGDGECSGTQVPYPKYQHDIVEVFGEINDERTIDNELLAITACDKEDGDFVTCNCSYEIVGGNTGHYFEIDVNTGMIQQIRPVDREKNPYFELEITATDHGEPARQSRNTALLNITVKDLDDNWPSFNQTLFAFRVSNNRAIGDDVGYVRAIDPDFGVNGSATYSVMQDDSSFTYNETSGYFQVSEPLTNLTGESFDIALSAVGVTTTNFRNFTFVKFTVYFDDPNKQAPEFNRSIFKGTFPYSAKKGRHIGTYIAVDNDTGIYGDVTYHLENNFWDTFIVDENSGSVSLLNDVINAIPFYIKAVNLTIVATDGGNPPKSGSCIIHFDLTGDGNVECSNRPDRNTGSNEESLYKTPMYAVIAVASCLLLLLVIGFLVMFSRNRNIKSKYIMSKNRLSTLENIPYGEKEDKYQRLSKNRSSGEYNRAFDYKLEDKYRYQKEDYDQLDEYDRAYDPEPDYDTTGI
ncbi:protein dachsous-like [Argopecten irradians]|uniref:protein dachsous-like n=1 Tax=Argopecten irradians TaxID=31199 RepID=UPI0037163554